MARGRTFTRRGPRRRYQWIREISSDLEVVDGATLEAQSVTDAEILAEGLAAPTLVRIRGEVFAHLDSVTASANETASLGIGIIVVPSTVSGSEVTGPITSPNLEWMYWRALGLQVPSGFPTVDSANIGPGIVRVDIDVKAMRKIHKSQVLVILENRGDATISIFARVALSYLFQE